MEDLSAIVSQDVPEPSEKDVLRHAIEAQVGDDKALLGTLSDVSGALLAFLAIRVICLADHASNEAQRQELDLLKGIAGGVDIVAKCREFLAAVQSGDVVLTAAVKGVDGVLAEAAERSTRTAEVLRQAVPDGGVSQ